MITTLIANDYATLHELKTKYTIEDAYDLYEVLAVTRYNEFLAHEDAKRKARQARK